MEGADGKLHNVFGTKRLGWEWGTRTTGNNDGGFELPSLKIPALQRSQQQPPEGHPLEPFARGAHTVALHVVDCTRQPTTVQQLKELMPPAALFGTFYLRQV